MATRAKTTHLRGKEDINLHSISKAGESNMPHNISYIYTNIYNPCIHNTHLTLRNSQALIRRLPLTPPILRPGHENQRSNVNLGQLWVHLAEVLVFWVSV